MIVPLFLKKSPPRINYLCYFHYRLRDDINEMDANFDYQSVKTRDTSNKDPTGICALHSQSCLTRDKDSLKVLKKINKKYIQEYTHKRTSTYFLSFLSFRNFCGNFPLLRILRIKKESQSSTILRK